MTRRAPSGSLKRTRARTFVFFEKRFHPITRHNSTLIWHIDELTPAGRRNPREWWTILDCDGHLYLSAGFRFVNRLGYVRCQVPWTGEDQLAGYRYD